MIDLNKKYTTRDGHEVKLFAVLDRGVFGAIKDKNWVSHEWDMVGNSDLEDDGDNLVEVEEKTEKVTMFGPVYRSLVSDQLVCTGIWTTDIDAIDSKYYIKQTFEIKET